MVIEANKKKYAYLKPDIAQKHYLDKLSEIEIANQFRDDLVYSEDTKAYKKIRTKYYNVWCLLMETIGENPLPPDFLVSDKPYSQTFKPVSRLPQITKSPKLQNDTKVKKMEELAFPRVFKPEAGIFVMNTQHIQELNNKQMEDGSYEPSVNQIEHQVNIKLKQPERGAGFGTVTFTNQQYFSEAMRLSTHPELLKSSLVHPICKFVPSRSDEPQDDVGQNLTIRLQDQPNVGSNFSIVQSSYLAGLSNAHRRQFLSEQTLRSAGNPVLP